MALRRLEALEDLLERVAPRELEVEVIGASESSDTLMRLSPAATRSPTWRVSR